MASEKTIAIVTRLVEFSETSLIVTLMTKDFGKITAMAKGARRHKSPFESALDLLAECRIVFIKKSSGAMSLLTEAKLERRFRSSATSLNRLYAGYFVIEMINALTDEGDPHPDLFESAKNFICKIDSPNYADSNLRLDLLKFEIELLISLGHKPMLG
ncbi:MAG: DNA repair protein RecO, partial [Planctomycetota bacterium]